MTNDLVYGVIPARKNSKGLPGKNFKSLSGKPLIHYSCEAAINSKLDKVFLNTDDEKIIEYVSKNFPQITIPFKRPSELAGDKSQAIEVAAHFLSWLTDQKVEIPKALCWLQPTSPLRTSHHINSCIDLYLTNDSSSVISMVKVSAMNPYKMKLLNGNYLVDAFSHNQTSSNRQELPTFLICNGAVFLSGVETLNKGTFYGEKSIPFIMSEELSVNIDSEIDFQLAEILMKKSL